MDFDQKLQELFIDLPEPATPAPGQVWALQVGKLLHVAGALPFSEGRIQHPGRAGVDNKLDTAKLTARLAAIQALAMASQELGGSLSKIRRIVRVDGYVACGADFRDHVKVIEGAGELFLQVFGPAGKHVRNAVGAMSLPGNACVQLAVTFELK